MLKPYPDRALARVPRVLGDLLVAAWTLAWTVAGMAVYRAVMALEAVADGISNTGRTFDDWIEAFRRSAATGLPFVGDLLQAQARALEAHSGQPLVGTGLELHDRIQQLALALGLATALPPILIVGAAYLAWRWRDSRERAAALAFVRSAARGGRLEEARALLAYRAVTSLDFRRIMKASRDPVGDLEAGRHDALAREMLLAAGLDPRRLPPADGSRPPSARSLQRAAPQTRPRLR